MKVIFFSVEVGAREIIPRFVLAKYLAQFGYVSVIGQKFSVNELLKHVPPSIFVYKDASKDAIKYFKCARDHGHRTIATDEEYSYAAEIPERYRGFVISKECTPLIDLYVSNSPQISMLAESRGLDPVVGGALRTGVAQLVRDKRGFTFNGQVQINTNAGYIAAPEPLSTHLEIYGKHYEGSKQDYIENFRSEVDLSFKNVVSLTKVYEELQTGGVPMFFRPHPSESEAFWRAVIGPEAKFDNRSLSSLTSILAGRAIVGFDCATLVEATLAGNVCFNLGSFHSYLLAGRVLPPCGADSIARVISELPRIRSEVEGSNESNATKFGDFIYTGQVFERWGGVLDHLDCSSWSDQDLVKLERIVSGNSIDLNSSVKHRFPGFVREELDLWHRFLDGLFPIETRHRIFPGLSTLIVSPSR